MSTNDPTILHYARIGKMVADEQAAEAAAKPPPVSTQVAQANRNQQLLYARHRREQQRVLEAAQAKAAQDQKERERQRDRALAEEADRRLASLKEQARAKWTLPASDFEKAWKDYLCPQMVQEQQASDEARLQRTPAYRAF